VEASRRRQTASRVKLQRDVQEATRNSLLTFAPSLQAGGGWHAQRFGRLCKRRRRRVRAEGSSGGLTDGCASCRSAQELQRQEKSGLRIATGVRGRRRIRWRSYRWLRLPLNPDYVSEACGAEGATSAAQWAHFCICSLAILHSAERQPFDASAQAAQVEAAAGAK